MLIRSRILIADSANDSDAFGRRGAWANWKPRAAGPVFPPSAASFWDCLFAEAKLT
jgi:hypothetical protein